MTKKDYLPRSTTVEFVADSGKKSEHLTMNTRKWPLQLTPSQIINLMVVSKRT